MDFQSTISSNLHNGIVLKSELLAHKKSRAASAVARVAPAPKRKDPPVMADPPESRLLKVVAASGPTRVPVTDRLVKGAKMKKQVLDDYQERYGGNHPEPITTQPVKGALSEQETPITV